MKRRPQDMRRTEQGHEVAHLDMMGLCLEHDIRFESIINP
jgi:hypothetical protein